jgi:hypothetical protein
MIQIYALRYKYATFAADFRIDKVNGEANKK